MSATPRQAEILDQLERARAILSVAPQISAGATVSVELVAGDPPKVEISVHQVEPPALEHLKDWSLTTSFNVDRDGILRWVVIEIAGVELTYYRR